MFCSTAISMILRSICFSKRNGHVKGLSHQMTMHSAQKICKNTVVSHKISHLPVTVRNFLLRQNIVDIMFSVLEAVTARDELLQRVYFPSTFLLKLCATYCFANEVTHSDTLNNLSWYLTINQMYQVNQDFLNVKSHNYPI